MVILFTCRFKKTPNIEKLSFYSTVIELGGQANLGWKYMFFQLVSSIKVILRVAKIIQSAYSCFFIIIIIIYLEKDFV